MQIVEWFPSSESGKERLIESYTDILAEQAKKQIANIIPHKSKGIRL